MHDRELQILQEVQMLLLSSLTNKYLTAGTLPFGLVFENSATRAKKLKNFSKDIMPNFKLI
jgi:hypothetical protein